MQMGPLQIASEYRTGKDKSKTIKALAELNLCTQREIAELLQAQGETLPGHWIEKLANPPKTQRRARGVPEGETPHRCAELPCKGSQETEGVASLSLAEERIVPSRAGPTPECASVRNDREGAVLSLDEIRQTALELILDRSPGEPTRFQGYALGVAALARELENKAERKLE